ncbi:hypothetical protein F892_01724 [Acinetobacter vivianii]|uniref:Phage abortive infection protein n=1 Tax=Acinetobacter vivianii TaxID=1776742 RepID=N9Q6A3_9GAMM|nr:hypothetical protein [Acinetobacter vivianii]ENX22482.1 hypothetical protein F892_01724 [Acinetobacter vivianii]GGI58851.1 hypothetical protein GCM10011446_03460 [Acinetobacter vivianii]
MKSDKSTFYAILLWGIVIYAIALLIYCTLRNYSADSKDFISDFGSIIGGVGTFFAAFVAAYLFNDWRTEKSYDLHKEYLQDFSQNLSKINSIISESNWWFIHFYQKYNETDEDGNLKKSVSLRKIIVHDYREVQKIINNLENCNEFFELYYQYENLIDMYNKYIYIFSQLCFINEEVETLYNNFSKSEDSDQSVFITYYINFIKLEKNAKNAIETIINKLETRIDTQQAEPVLYEKASETLQDHYKCLKSIIANKLDLPVKKKQS